MTDKTNQDLADTLKSFETRIEKLEDQYCTQKAYIHALEALTMHIIIEHGIDEDAVQSSLNSLLHEAPKTDLVAQKRASYLINFKRLDKSAALYASKHGHHGQS